MRSASGRIGIISAAIALGLACSSAPSHPPLETSGTETPSNGGGGGGGDSGTAEDGGSCAPSLGEFTFIDHPPARVAGACTAAQLSTVYNACFASTSTSSECTTSWTSLAANSTCNSCLLANSDPTGANGSSWGPILQYAFGVELNVSGCLALDVPSEEASDCAQASQTLSECIDAACDTSCGGTSADFASCATAAQSDTTACASYLATYQTACAVLSSSVCFSGAGDEATFTAITGIFCE